METCILRKLVFNKKKRFKSNQHKRKFLKLNFLSQMFYKKNPLTLTLETC